MRRLILLGSVAAAVLVPAATASPAATHTLRGTVIAKDRAHHALVVARPGGAVQSIVAPKAFTRVAIGRRVVIRLGATAGLAKALSVTPGGSARTALVHGTIVRLATRTAVINAGGSLLRVRLAAPGGQRKLASARSGPEVGDEVEVEVEIGSGGGLDADGLVQAGGSAGAAPGGELEVRGKVTTLVEATATAAGTITVTSLGASVACAIPAGSTPGVAVGDLVELECALTGDPAVWTVRVVKGEDDHASAGDAKKESSAGSFTGSPAAGTAHGDDGDADEVEVQGAIAASFTQLSTTVTVTPTTGDAVTCAITAGALSAFAAGDAVKMECTSVAGVLTLKEIEKVQDGGKVEDEHEGGHDAGGDDHGDD